MNKVFAAVARYIKQTDRTLIFFSVLASLYGLLLVYSSTLYLKTSAGGISRMVPMQIVAISIGFIVMVILSKFDYHSIAGWWKVIAVLSAIFLLLTLVLGKGRDGSADRSWLRLGSLSVQPSELVKVAFVITFSKHYDMVKDDASSPKNVLLLCLHGAVPIGIILLEKDMGMALVFVAIFISMMFATNIKLRYFAGGAIALLIGAPIIWNTVFGAGSTQQNRILALFDPTNAKYIQEMYQQNQGVAAISSGEIWGYGLFKGPITQSLSASSLPERYNDMIFAVVGEELGLIGCIAVLLILSVMLVRFLIDAGHSKDVMGSMMCVGIFSTFAIQIIVNIGMVLRLLPVVGLALPLYSYGGSSVLSSFIAIGVVLSVYMHRKDLMFADQES